MSCDDYHILDSADVSLLEALDHVLNRGLVVTGDIVISVADVDLIYIGLHAVVGAVETVDLVLKARDARETES